MSVVSGSFWAGLRRIAGMPRGNRAGRITFGARGSVCAWSADHVSHVRWHGLLRQGMLVAMVGSGIVLMLSLRALGARRI